MHIDAGHKLTIKNLSGQDLAKALCEKLHEEADEVSSALSRDELIEEIADVQQVLNDLCKLQNINKDTLEDVRMKKDSLMVVLQKVSTSIRFICQSMMNGLLTAVVHRANILS